MRVPFLDLRVQHEPLMTELVDAFRQVTETSAFAGGPFVARFETEFAAFCQTRHALGVGSGTDALWLSSAGVGGWARRRSDHGPQQFHGDGRSHQPLRGAAGIC